MDWLRFFLLPFRRGKGVINQQKSELKFTKIYKDSLSKIIFHKKAILAPILLIFVLIIIWLTYDATEYHINAHSGYPPISTDLKAFYSMLGVFVYTIGLVLLIAFLRTVKIVKDAR